MNILNHPFDTPYQSPPFSSLKTEMYAPAIAEEIEKTRKAIDAIANNPAPPTFENTVEALEFTGLQLEVITSVFFNLNNAETNEVMQKTAQEISPVLTEFANDIRLNQALFERVKAVYEKRNELDLDAEQTMLLDKKFKSFSRNGALLSDTDKETLRQIDKDLAKLALTFGENVLAETNAYELHLTDKKDLEGLPEYVVEAAREEAEQREKEGWVFTLNYPSYIPFMTYAKNRELRKRIHLAFGSKGAQKNKNNNEEIILQTVALRYKRAQLLGYQSHAHFVLEERMAKSPDKVRVFLNDLLEKARPAAEKEFDRLSEFARETDGLSALEKWDGAYYTEKLKQKLFDLDDDKLKPYFQLENVVNGVFTVAEKLFGLRFVPAPEIDTYHTDVKAFRAIDEKGEMKAVFYTDFHPRKGKRNGAWMTSFRPQYKLEGEHLHPHVSIVCNFTKPTETKPALLTFNEVTTLFHEFGHALHGMLANTTYPSLSGTSVYWDFVELPSQVMENWCYEKEALELFAKHYQTGEIIPMEYVQKIRESSTFMEGMQTLRQLSFGLLDMSWHQDDPSAIKAVKPHEDAVFKDTDLYPSNPETCMSTAFSHIFQGGYSSGYYSYKWAEVLDADAFELFKERGIFDRETAMAFHDNILSKGGTEDPMTLYKKFRGQEPKPEALLRRAGLM